MATDARVESSEPQVAAEQFVRSFMIDKKYAGVCSRLNISREKAQQIHCRLKKRYKNLPYALDLRKNGKRLDDDVINALIEGSL